MRLKRETQGAFCVLNANAKSQTRKSMKIDVICTVPLDTFYAVIYVVFPSEMFIDYHTKKFEHLNTLKRFILYYKLCFGVYDTSTSMYLVFVGLTDNWLALNQSFRLLRSALRYSYIPNLSDPSKIPLYRQQIIWTWYVLVNAVYRSSKE